MDTTRFRFDRRALLRGTGVCLALPWLETFAKDAAPAAQRRFVCIANPFGMIHDAFFPAQEGLDTTLPNNLAPLEPLRGKFTVFSNLDHGFSSGHAATHTFLSGVQSA
jgi:hypothetical protein